MNGTFDMEAFGFGAAMAMMIVYLIAIILSIVQYVLFSLGLYDTARKRQIRHAWLAWIPLIGNWVLGAVVDYHAARRGQERRWRTVMLWICIAIVTAYVLLIVIMFSRMFMLGFKSPVDEMDMLSIFGSILVPYLLLILAFLAYLPCYAVCLYKVYEEILPEKAVKYLLLSYLVPLALGICMGRCARVTAEPASPAGIAAPGAEGDFIPQDPFAETNQEK